MENSYFFGERVEIKIMYGRLARCWLPAEVIKVNGKQNTVNVCVLNHIGYNVTKFHIDVPLCYVRRSKWKFNVGDHVFTKILRGRKQGLWIPASIIFINHDGTFDLLVEQFRTYLVTKYSVHVPEKYLIPGNSSIVGRGSTFPRNVSFSLSKSYGENKSPGSKNGTTNSCDLCQFCAKEREQSKEIKSSSTQRSLTIDRSYINNLQLFQSCGQLPSESRFLEPNRSITVEPCLPVVGKHSKLIARPSSVSIEQDQFSFAWTLKQGFKPRYCERHGHLQPPGCHSAIKPPLFIKPPHLKTNSLSSRESYKDLETSQLPSSGQSELVKLGNQQKQESEDEKSQSRPLALQKLISDWGEQFDWSKSPRSHDESPTSVSHSATMTDWDLSSPRKSGTPTKLSNFTSKRDSGRRSISSRYADRPMSIGGKSTIVSTPRRKCDFMASYLSQDKATSSRKDWISIIRVKGYNIKHKMIAMDTPLDELGLWLSEGSNMVKMISFRKNMIPIRSKIGESMDGRLRKYEGYKLSDLLGKCVDSSKQGLAFFVGPVNGKLCYKITVFEKDNASSMGGLQTNANSFVNSRKV